MDDLVLAFTFLLAVTLAIAATLLGGYLNQRSKSVHASICVVCNNITWVMQWGDGRHWQCSAQALRQACWRRIEGLRLRRKGLPPTN
jgi:hypothetical protein